MFRSILILFAFSLNLVAGHQTGAGLNLPVIRKAPSLTFKVPGGKQRSLTEFAGKVVIVEFIETTCPHCQAASHVMTKLQHEMGPRGFQAIDIAINTADETVISAFTLTQQTDFLIGWCDLYTMAAFTGITPGERFVVPQLILIDRSGNIRYQTPATGEEGVTEEGFLKPRVLTLLNQKK